MLRPIISGLVAVAVVYLLSRTVQRTPAQRGNRSWVEFGRVYKLLSALFFPFSAFITYAALQASPDQIGLALLLTLAFWTMTLYFAYVVFLTTLSYDDEYIYHWTLLRRERQIPWNAVRDLNYSALKQAFTVKTNGYSDISISESANGCEALVERVVAQLQADAPD